ncbi:MAG: prepilin-type N-terminal cleavage/methylation domain-containing protein [Luteolibacter sp.]
MSNRKLRGFTMIELLVVIAVIVVLSAAVFAIGNRMLFKSRAAVMAANMKQIAPFFTAYATEPTRTPIIAPADNYFYRYDDAQIDEWDTGTISGWLVDGNFPVLFLDGHIESVKPEQYIERRLHEMPLDANLP